MGKTMKEISSSGAAIGIALLMALPAHAATPAPNDALRVVAHIPGPDGGWDYASFDSARRRVYVAHGDRVLSLDVKTGKLNPDFASGDHLHAIVPVPGADVLVTTNSGDDSVRILRATDGELIKSLHVASDADGAAYDPATRQVVVVNGDPGVLTLIDPLRRRVTATVQLHGKLEFVAVDGKGNAYVNVESTGEVAVVDLRRRVQSALYPMPGCQRPTGIAFVSHDRIVSACGGGGVRILDAADGHVIASFKTGAFPDAVIYDPKRQLAMAPSAMDGKLNLIALSGPHDNEIVGRVDTQIGARTGAVDPLTGRVYLPTAQYNLPVPPGQRPTIKPGTFQILVLDRTSG